MIEKPDATKITPKWYILSPLIAMLGGFFGILTAGYENSGYGWFFAAFIVAPIFEEAVKPCGVYWLYARRPQALSGIWVRPLKR